jgi:hypothetical protein
MCHSVDRKKKLREGKASRAVEEWNDFRLIKLTRKKFFRLAAAVCRRKISQASYFCANKSWKPNRSWVDGWQRRKKALAKHFFHFDSFRLLCFCFSFRDFESIKRKFFLKTLFCFLNYASAVWRLAWPRDSSHFRLRSPERNENRALRADVRRITSTEWLCISFRIARHMGSLGCVIKWKRKLENILSSSSADECRLREAIFVSRFALRSSWCVEMREPHNESSSIMSLMNLCVLDYLFPWMGKQTNSDVRKLRIRKSLLWWLESTASPDANYWSFREAFESFLTLLPPQPKPTSPQHVHDRIRLVVIVRDRIEARADLLPTQSVQQQQFVLLLRRWTAIGDMQIRNYRHEKYREANGSFQSIFHHFGSLALDF